jgi:hypothetical protein
VKVFRGAHPADLPVEQPTKNEVSAGAMGLNFSLMLLARADEVTE